MDKLMTAKEVGEYLGVSARSVLLYARQGKLPSKGIGKRVVRFLLSDVDKMLDKNKASNVTVTQPAPLPPVADAQQTQAKEPIQTAADIAQTQAIQVIRQPEPSKYADDIPQVVNSEPVDINKLIADMRKRGEIKW